MSPKVRRWLKGKKTYLGLAAGSVYAGLIALGVAESNEWVWIIIGTWTGAAFRSALN
jgi:hypothetical protein